MRQQLYLALFLSFVSRFLSLHLVFLSLASKLFLIFYLLFANKCGYFHPLDVTSVAIDIESCLVLWRNKPSWLIFCWYLYTFLNFQWFMIHFVPTLQWLIHAGQLVQTLLQNIAVIKLTDPCINRESSEKYLQIHIWIVYSSLQIGSNRYNYVPTSKDAIFCEGGEDVDWQDQFGRHIGRMCFSEVLTSPRRQDRKSLRDSCINKVWWKT